MRRTFTVIALVLATAGPAAAQSTSSRGHSKCPIARMTLLGAAVGFGAGAYLGFGLNVFEDTYNGEGKAWTTVIGLTVAGAVIGNVFARRECAAASSPKPHRSPAVVLTEADLQRLSRTVRLLPTRQPLASGNSPANLATRVSDAHIDRLVEAITSTEHPGVGACSRMPGSRRSPS
jgi:hypothetical protein